MSIVNKVSEKLPEEGQAVYCDNGKFANDIAVFKNGKFIGGGDFPVASYEMNQVSKWFDWDEYMAGLRFIDSCSVNFDNAEIMGNEFTGNGE